MNDPSAPRGRERLQKYLARCGVGSRRACEDLIRAGRVRVDGRAATVLGTTVDPAAAKVEVDGRPVTPEAHAYILLNKPRGVVCTSHDPEGRPRAIDFVRGVPGRIYTVGRLDFASEGLILLTNDGALAHRLMHPRHHIEKTYEVWVEPALNRHAIRQLEHGVVDGDETLRTLAVTRSGKDALGFRYQVVLGEGRNRHIRRMMAAVGVRVKRLVRIRMGDLSLGTLKPGEFRDLTPGEREALS